MYLSHIMTFLRLAVPGVQASHISLRLGSTCGPRQKCLRMVWGLHGDWDRHEYCNTVDARLVTEATSWGCLYRIWRRVIHTSIEMTHRHGNANTLITLHTTFYDIIHNQECTVSKPTFISLMSWKNISEDISMPVGSVMYYKRLWISSKIQTVVFTT